MKRAMLDCNIHDYIEVACLYKIEVMLTLKDGNIVKGIPIITITSKEKEEFLTFRVKSLSEDIDINLLSIKFMEAISYNNYFARISFI
ncbi:Rho-binding antiterminator [Colwellia sp. MSW7]|uniref:Rho-binding antiterminator n=1 Tax=Colwellia maritima TaxID=2912588 RepID=A0ABS9WWM4_9GAMM|nr:Rho-binding antiterminator [Colwellia maritima]MCI2282358.1 Rho-binding antiterminator [Colwellia maritima]